MLLDAHPERGDRAGAALDREPGEVAERDRRLVGERPALAVGEGEEALQQTVALHFAETSAPIFYSTLFVAAELPILRLRP